MKKYDYFEAMKTDVKTHIRENYTAEEIKNADPEELIEEICDACWIDDSVTGNGSGSYFNSIYEAEEAICHNLGLLAEAAEEFCSDINILKDGAHTCDVTIRCYLLPQIVPEALREMYPDYC